METALGRDGKMREAGRNLEVVVGFETSCSLAVLSPAVLPEFFCFILQNETREINNENYINMLWPEPTCTYMGAWLYEKCML